MSKRARVPGMTAGQAASARISLGRVARYRRRREESEHARVTASDIRQAGRVLDHRRDQALEQTAEPEAA